MDYTMTQFVKRVTDDFHDLVKVYAIDTKTRLMQLKSSVVAQQVKGLTDYEIKQAYQHVESGSKEIDNILDWS